MSKKNIILRHRKENLKKCSLRGLETREDFLFLTYPKDLPFDFSHCIVLSLNAPLLTKEDDMHPLLLIDATWRYASAMLEKIKPHTSCDLYRSLPSHFRTAYPRRQEDCPLKEQGLASVEALYLAYHLLGRDTTGLLDNYYWKESFLQKNDLLS